MKVPHKANRNRGIWVLVVEAILIMIITLTTDQSSLYPIQQPNSSNLPYIEVAQFDEEIPLVGDVVVEWTKGERSATELYDQYSQFGRVYDAKPVVMNYAIFNIPLGVTIVNQELELSTSDTFDDADKITIGKDKRSIRLDYLYSGTTYYYRLSATLSNGSIIQGEGTFKTANTPRIIALDGVRNMRDIGGWKTVDGKVIKQGLLYRGSELDGAKELKHTLTDFGIEVMLNQLGIKMDMDLRSSSLPNVKDVLGEGVKHSYYSFLSYTVCFTDSGKRSLKNIFSDLAIKENYPIYLHCSYGADRTGTVCYFLEAMLGLSEEDLYREWELSILANGGAFYEEMEEFVKAFKSFEGDTMQEKSENYLLSIGVTRQEMDNIKEILLEEQ